MIVVLDASAAIKVIIQQGSIKAIIDHLKKADWVIAPDIYVSEVTNVFWKYHHFENLPLDTCENALIKAIALIDDFVNTRDMHREAFSLSCQIQHPVYDSMYLVCARRHNGILVSADKKLNQIAQKQSIKTAQNAML